MFNYNLLQKYCNDNNIFLLEDYKNKKINRDYVIKAKCLNQNCNNIVEKVLLPNFK